MSHPKVAPKSPAFVGTIVELSHLLGVSRRSISTWQRIAGSPRPRSDGRHDVAAWKTWLRQHGRKGGESPELDSARKRLIEKQIEKLDEAVRTLRRANVPVVRIEASAAFLSAEIRRIAATLLDGAEGLVMRSEEDCERWLRAKEDALIGQLYRIGQEDVATNRGTVPPMG